MQFNSWKVPKLNCFHHFAKKTFKSLIHFKVFEVLGNSVY